MLAPQEGSFANRLYGKENEIKNTGRLVGQQDKFQDRCWQVLLPYE